MNVFILFYVITLKRNVSKSYLFLDFFHHFQLFRDIRGSCGGSAFDCQHPVSSPLPEALTLRSIFSTCFCMPYCSVRRVQFYCATRGQCCNISDCYLAVQHQVLLQPAVADLASKGVSQLFTFAWLKFKVYHFDFIPCYKTSCKLITTMCYCMRNQHFKVITS